MRPSLRLFVAASTFGAIALGLVACIGDTPTAPTSDASTGSDTSTNDAATLDASADADAGEAAPPPCNTIPASTPVNMPNSGGFPAGGASGPIIAGDYTLSAGEYSCGCNTAPSTASGGVKISIVNADVIVERNITFTVQGQPAQTVLDRWKGTYDQPKQNFLMKRECPEGDAGTAIWPARPLIIDGGTTKTIVVGFANDFKGKNNDNPNNGATPIFRFTRP